MRVKLAIVFVVAASLMAYGQGRSHGGLGQGAGMGAGMGQGTGMGQGAGMGRGGDMGRGSTDHNQGQMGQRGRMDQTQQPLRDAQINGGAFRMLEKKTGMTVDQLKALYASSGAKNFGEFVSALVVAKNLGLDQQKVLDGLKTQSLGQTIQSLGVDKKTASAEIKKAQKEIKDADTSKESS